MNDIKNFKELTINNYISQSVDLENLDDLDIEKIKEDLKDVLHESPAVEFKYETEIPLLEDGSKGKRTRKLKAITVAYTYEENGQIRFSKLDYVVG